MMMKAKPVRTSSKLPAPPSLSPPPKGTQLKKIVNCVIERKWWEGSSTFGFLWTDVNVSSIFLPCNARLGLTPNQTSLFPTREKVAEWSESSEWARAGCSGPTTALMISLHPRWFQSCNRFHFIRVARVFKCLADVLRLRTEPPSHSNSWDFTQLFLYGNYLHV